MNFLIKNKAFSPFLQNARKITRFSLFYKLFFKNIKYNVYWEPVTLLIY
jgi:hypothetical protein